MINPLKYKVPDKAFSREINNMVVNCPECCWKGKYPDYKSHDKIHEKICFDSVKQLDSEDLSECLNRKNASAFEAVFNNILTRIEAIENCFSDTTLMNSVFPTQTKGTVCIPKSKKENDQHIGPSDDSDDSDSEIVKKLAANESKLNCLGKEVIVSFNQTDILKKKVKDAKRNESELREKFVYLKKELMLANATIIELKEKILLEEQATFNGKLVWKITNIREKIQEATSGRQSSIYSPPFYTSQYGFKMCARLFLNGDGMARNTHVSIFFALLKGEYDALLRWPFRQKITFILLDQSTNKNKENVIYQIKPNPKSKDFNRPTNQMNNASGIPLFCPLSKLNSKEFLYVKGDAMCIKIIVDTRNLI